MTARSQGEAATALLAPILSACTLAAREHRTCVRSAAASVTHAGSVMAPVNWIVPEAACPAADSIERVAKIKQRMFIGYSLVFLRSNGLPP